MFNTSYSDLGEGMDFYKRLIHINDQHPEAAVMMLINPKFTEVYICNADVYIYVYMCD